VFYTEISEDNIGVLAAYQQGFTCCFCRSESYLDDRSCIEHLGGFPSTLLDLGDYISSLLFLLLAFSEVFSKLLDPKGKLT
jgi:hypothetical protein